MLRLTGRKWERYLKVRTKLD